MAFKGLFIYFDGEPGTLELAESHRFMTVIGGDDWTPKELKAAEGAINRLIRMRGGPQDFVVTIQERKAKPDPDPPSAIDDNSELRPQHMGAGKTRSAERSKK